MAILPMFPLGTVLFPSQVLPLHIFEPRYCALARDVLAAEGEFGVVLIERGSEVGGGDVRTDIGTVARVVSHQEYPGSPDAPDGRWALATVGVRRLKVERWLDDDPYPRAEVTDFTDPHTDLDSVGGPYRDVVELLRTSLARKSELREPAPAVTVEISEEAETGSFQVAALAPLSTIDQQKVLGVAGLDERLGVLNALLSEEIEFLDARIAMAGNDPD